MRTLAKLLNIAVIIFVIYNLVDSGMPNADDLFIVLLLSSTPIVSLLALHTHGPMKTGWLGLFFERKRLEEEQRIQKLRGDQ